ncbi:WASP homolog-associated protein with actin, membranes and microtubules isoform X2 [Dasypus novemcinctus]|uniref:WASP homolog-associated protein with actin, membranes and microtubules isoform X2 n=1 Tax=Dasypus novemcinctus TaxID=9361 RepID=UPI00265FB6A7|nr:WASP homolog-associated protein with actin, membranes and microtubules isoform X2 [Dasypus novemcinctus]
MDDQPDSLEGWVPLREDLFTVSERHQLRFLVAWNDAEGKFAVTCHDRTAQRRRPGAAGPAPAAPPPSWAGLLSAAGLRGAHRQLAALWPPLESCLPHLPPELEADGGRGLWALVWPARAGPGEAALLELCGQLERYLAQAADGCGAVALRDALFPAPGGAADCESLREFRERALRARCAEARARLRQVLEGHENANTMVVLMKVYQEEDEAYQELVTMATMFYQYLLQPFRDMREVATSCKLDILKSLEEGALGPKRIAALQKEAEEWTRRAEEAVVSIQDITVNYFKETVKALAGMQKQMEQDGKRFGQAAWASATPRLEKLKLLLARETLQLMRAKELCLNHKKAEIRGKMEDLPEEEKNINVVDELEIQYYEVQLELYEVKFEILKYEEILLITQLDSIKRLIKEKEDEVVYYDTCESPEELKVFDGAVGLQKLENLEMKELSRQCQWLESKRGRVCARRAYLRNKKDQCKENHQLRLQQAEESVKYFHRHHSIQMKRDKIKEEEQKKKEWINQEREKTLQRLRTFKEKCPSQSTLKTSCSEPVAPNLPRGLSRLASSPASQPLSVIHPPWRKTGSTPLSEVSHVKTPEAQDCPGTVRMVGDQTHSKARSMDEVLASLRHGRTPLQKVEVPARPPPRASVNEHILAAIRQGVKLKKVHPDSGLSPSRKPPSDLERSIKAALQRIKRVSADSEEDSEEPGEWDH